jgi:hypothetical protein
MLLERVVLASSMALALEQAVAAIALEPARPSAAVAGGCLFH